MGISYICFFGADPGQVIQIADWVKLLCSDTAVIIF